MPAVHLDHLSFRYSSAVDILDDVTAHLGPGWTGVVGANGSGKTTLLRLIAADLEPTGGTVATEPAEGVVVLCAQAVEQIDATIDRLASSWEGADVALRARLELRPEDLRRWALLSPGERKRWQVGAALAMRPDVLLLDEPTNHLDDEGRAWLIESVAGFDGVGLVVSHDRTVLDRLTSKTLRLGPRGAELWVGRYSVACESWSAEERARTEALQSLRREQKKLARRVADQRRAAEAKRAAFKRQQRTSDPKDIDARSAAATAVFRSGEQAAAHRLAATTRAYDRVTEAAGAFDTVREVGRSLFVDFEPSPKRDLTVRSGPLLAGNRVLLEDAPASLSRSDRVWLRGANGAGKTTLLEDMLRRAALPRHRVLFMPQETSAAEGAAVLREVVQLPPNERGRVLSLVAALGVDPAVLLQSELPSPGEARKLTMALGLGRLVWLLALDEPTNHLDLPSIERLEAALIDYPGAMIIVSHDEAFGSRLDLEEWHIAEGMLRT